MPHHPPHPRAGFTLVELLMVIAIIGILVGLLLPAVFWGLRSAKTAGLALEVMTLANAIHQYKNKYGDYPPDGSNSVLFERHYRKIFPQIAEAEFQLLYRPISGNVIDRLAKSSDGNPLAVMDPPEALVFALGGFSDDPIRPFTGPGGPFSLVPTTTNLYQYNTARTGALYEFKESQLTLDNSGTAALSNDESTLGVATLVDAMPAYRPSYGLKLPFVYFDKRTYSFPLTNGLVYFNQYQVPSAGVARPYKSGQLNKNVSEDGGTADQYYKYANEKTYQIVCGGLDDNYGGVPFDWTSTSGYTAPSPSLPIQGPTQRTAGISGPIFYAFPTGDALDFGAVDSTHGPTINVFTRYWDTNGSVSAQLDNITNFSDGALRDGLTN